MSVMTNESPMFWRGSCCLPEIVNHFGVHKRFSSCLKFCFHMSGLSSGILATPIYIPCRIPRVVRKACVDKGEKEGGFVIFLGELHGAAPR